MKERIYSQRRGCALTGIEPRVHRRQPTRPADRELRERLQELSGAKRRFSAPTRASTGSLREITTNGRKRPRPGTKLTCKSKLEGEQVMWIR